MSTRYPTVKQQEDALDEIRRVLIRDITVLTSDEEADNATPEILERVVLFEGILNMFTIFDEKVTAAVMICGKIKGVVGACKIHTPELLELKDQANICLELLIGPEE